MTGSLAPLYELPSARRVVGAGLQLAVASSRDLRRASIYIGMLTLGAIGPTVLFALVMVASLGPEAIDLLGSSVDAETAAVVGGLEGSIVLLQLLALVGFVLFAAISIDAQAIAIAILGARAGDRPISLWQAIVRARQVFWRLLAASLLVGLIGVTIQVVVRTLLALVSQGDTFADNGAPVIAAVLEAPFAYAASGIVLGDVGAVETIRRSYRLFRARARIAVVVMLFTLVTAAIQVFALGAGLDLLARTGELLHASLTGGAISFLLAGALVLAAVVAFGSLLFTVAAIVAAPQVAAFLGLTHYAAGLDAARGDVRPAGFRTVTPQMTGAMVLVAAIAAFGIAERL